MEDRFEWPDLSSISASNVHSFTVDVEEWFQVGAFENTLSVKDWPQLESRVELQTHKILKILQDHKIKATFFCLGWVAERVPSLLKEICEHGHEIACHGMAHQRLYTMSRQEFRADIKKSKQLIENAAGVEIAGYRAPSFSLTNEVWWVYEELKNLGFKYSSSLYPVKTDHYGDAETPRQPFYPCGASGVLEIPMTVCDTGLKRVPASGGGYFRLLPYKISKYLLENGAKQSNVPAIFYMHPWEIDPEQPYVKEAPLLSKFRHYQGQKNLPQKLSKLMTDLKWDSMSNVYASLLAGDE